MTTTQNLHLPQWEASDFIQRTDFNDAFAAIDAAGTPKMFFGSYVGTGEYGEQHPNSITFPFTPKFIIFITETAANLSGSYADTSKNIFLWGLTTNIIYGKSYRNFASYSGNTISWWTNIGSGGDILTVVLGNAPSTDSVEEFAVLGGQSRYSAVLDDVEGVNGFVMP